MEHAVLQSLLAEHAAGIRAHFDEAISQVVSQMATKDDLRALETRFSAIETRFTALETRFTALEARFTALERRVAALEDRVASLESRVASLEARMDTFEKRLDAAVVEMRHQFEIVAEDLRGQIGILAEGLMALSEKVDRLDERVMRLEASSRFTH